MAMSLEEHLQSLNLTDNSKTKKSTQTTYRYHINATEHYTAVQMNDEILEVKGPHAGTKYPSLDKWMESIGVQKDQLEITEEKKSKRKINEKKSSDTTTATAPSATAPSATATSATAPSATATSATATSATATSATATSEATPSEATPSAADATAATAASAETKAKKTKVEKLKMDIPTKRSPIISTRWARHVYEMMVEANVTITDEIIHAYNNLVKCLKKYPQLSTSTPPKSERYKVGIELKLIEHYIDGIFLHFQHTTPYDTRKIISEEIMQTYLPLYESIKDIVVPFMKNKFQYTNAVRLLEKNKTQMILLHDSAEELIKKHEQTLASTYRRIEDTRREIKKLEEIVTKHSM